MRNHTKFTNHFAKKDGFVYTTMAIIFTILFMLVVIDMAALRLGSIDDQTNREQNYKAKSVATTGRNLGLGLSADMSPGEEVEKRYICYIDSFTNPTIGIGTPPSNNPQCAKFVGTYEVKSLAGDIDLANGLGHQRYIVPPPGEGDAGENCIRPVNYNNPLHTVDENILKPCNWNKLYYGKAVAIPLYITDDGNSLFTSNGGTINPVDLPDGLNPSPAFGLNSFTIKVRTPCDMIEYDASGKALAGTGDEDDWCLDDPTDTGNDARPDLEDGEPVGDPNDFSPTDIIVHWQIVSQCDYTPGTSNDGECIGMAISPTGPYIDPAVPYSDINKEAINDAKNNSFGIQYGVVGSGAIFPPDTRNRIDDLNVVSGNNHPTILDYLKNNLATSLLPPGTTSVVINRPVLYLSAVSPMTTYIDPVYYPEDNEYVPYIEYQIETDQPISDSNFTIRATGKFGNHSKTKKAKRTIFNAFPSFVFQN